MATDEMTDATTGENQEPGSMSVDLEGVAEPDISTYDPDDGNLERFFAESEKGKAFLKRLAQQVVEDFDRAWEESEEYRNKIAENDRIMTGFLLQKDLPFQGCANAHAPLMLERLMRLSSSVFAEIFTDRDQIFNVQPTGPDDQLDAEILTRHGNWQIKNELTDFVRQQHRGLTLFFKNGSVFCKSWRDMAKGRNRHDVLTCEELVFPYTFVSTETDMSDVPFKIAIVRKYKQELERLRAEGAWSNVDKVFDKKPPPHNEDPDMVVRDQMAKWEGITAPDDDPNAPYKFYEYHGWAVLPGSEELRPICVTVDSVTHEVVKLYLREEDDWKDKARHDKEMAEWQQYKQDAGLYQAVMQKHMELEQRLSMGDVDPQEAMMVRSALSSQPMQPPLPPKWMMGKDEQVDPALFQQGPKPVKRVPIEMFSHGVCLENPQGSLGLSYGFILADFNKLANEALNRFYDSATLANCWSILIPETLQLDSGTIPFGPGKIMRIKGAVSGGQLKNDLVELRPGPANTQLLDIVRAVSEWGDGVTVSGIVSGEPGKSGETFRGVATRLERATKQLSVAGIKYIEFLSNILKNNARLNAMFMGDEEIFMTVNDLQVPEIQKIGRKLYQRDYRVTFSADVRFASQSQKVAEADEIVGMVNSIPPLQQNPAFVYAALRGALIARGKQELIPLLGPPPVPPQFPMGQAPQPPMGMPPGAEGAGPPQPPGPPQNGQEPRRGPPETATPPAKPTPVQ